MPVCFDKRSRTSAIGAAVALRSTRPSVTLTLTSAADAGSATRNDARTPSGHRMISVYTRGYDWQALHAAVPRQTPPADVTEQAPEAEPKVGPVQVGVEESLQ